MTERIKVIGARRYGALSPLRYPGGKAALAGFFADLIQRLGISKTHYVEPYAGGAGAGVALLIEGIVDHLTINDIDPAVYAFWRSITEENATFVEMVKGVPLTIEEWMRQRDIYRAGDSSEPLKLGFSFFYLNRTNRSGILTGGVIGGLDQTGNYKIDARFNRSALIDRLKKIGSVSSSITVSNLDGRTVVRNHSESENVFMYIDPPYVKAGGRLYLNSFEYRDHECLAQVINEADSANWVVTYDQSDLIAEMYEKYFQCELELTYSAQRSGKATELLIASESIANLIRAASGSVTFCTRCRSCDESEG